MRAAFLGVQHRAEHIEVMENYRDLHHNSTRNISQHLQSLPYVPGTLPSPVSEFCALSLTRIL